MPFIGWLISAFLAILITLINFDNITNLIIISLIYVVSNIIEANILAPKLIGKKINLGQGWILFSMIAGGNLFGLTGILGAIPIATISKEVIIFLIDIYKTSYLYDERVK